MTPDEKQRMIHIRIGDGTHRELRKAAAEYEVTMQEIVARAVEDKMREIEIEMRLEEAEVRLEEKALEVEEKARELEARASGLELEKGRLETVTVALEKDLPAGESPMLVELAAHHGTVIRRLEALEEQIGGLEARIREMAEKL